MEISDGEYKERISHYLTIILDNPKIRSNKELYDVLEQNYNVNFTYSISSIQRDLKRYLNTSTGDISAQRGKERFDLIRTLAKTYILSENDQEILMTYCVNIKYESDQNVYIWTENGCAEKVAQYLRDRLQGKTKNVLKKSQLFLIADYNSIFIHFHHYEKFEEFRKLITKYFTLTGDNDLI